MDKMRIYNVDHVEITKDGSLLSIVLVQADGTAKLEVNVQQHHARGERVPTVKIGDGVNVSVLP